MEPVSRKSKCKVGPGRFIPQYRRNKIGLVTVSILNKINAHNKLCSTRARELRIDLAHDAIVGERCRKQKISYGFTKIHLGVHLETSDYMHLRTL